MRPAEFADVPQRRFLALLGVSVALHGIVLFGVRLPSPPPVAPVMLAALQATLRLPAAVAARDAAPTPPATKVRQPPARRELRALPAVPGAAGPTAAAAAPSPALTSSPLAVDAPASVAAAAPAVPVPAAPTVADADAARRLADYGERLSELFARQQQYPRLALQRGWEGEVRVRLSVARRGSLAAIRLERSSGHAVLDRHALAMIEAIGELPPPPAEFLQFADDVQVVVPVHYRLRRAT